MSGIIIEIRKRLKDIADDDIKKSGEGFFREKVKLYGIKTSVGSLIAKEYYKKIRNETKEKIFSYCEELWKSGYLEESFIACSWSYNLRKMYMPEDFKIFERWVELYVNNWAACDTFCNHTVGAFIDMYPEYIENLKNWGKSENCWMRRAAAVSLIVPAKKGRYLSDIFDIADILMSDRNDLVQKGYGWMLKAASHDNQRQVFEYVMKNKSAMPRTALRYAIEKMPEELRKLAMSKA